MKRAELPEDILYQRPLPLIKFLLAYLTFLSWAVNFVEENCFEYFFEEPVIRKYFSLLQKQNVAKYTARATNIRKIMMPRDLYQDVHPHVFNI